GHRDAAQPVRRPRRTLVMSDRTDVLVVFGATGDLARAPRQFRPVGSAHPLHVAGACPSEHREVRTIPDRVNS
ncbi:MAG: hypothetical protein KY466_13660, partial [Gemmatimonadetes bacterium]|nr:hypothetical protein [Gemmatimonadota bacterium]